MLTVIAFASILIGSEKGVMHKALKRRAFKNKVLQENILKIFYHLGEMDQAILKPRSIDSLQKRRALAKHDLRKGLNQLISEKLVVRVNNNQFKLSEVGQMESTKLVRLHRLWELYLSEHLNIASDHVHDDAEAIEHILTPDLQARLESILEGSTKDPHNKTIPTVNKTKE